MSIFSSFTQTQKEAVGLLQIGTFLEYFDLMLYVHMAILLNDLFFPKTDPTTASFIAAFSFSSTYVLRPFGALLFGYIGDHIGRKITVIITTMMMATSCIVMATLPTYAQIGISAAWFVTICRIIQGLSSMGEVIGAEIYMTEITKPPLRYPAVGLIGCATRLGTMVALGVAHLVTSCGFNWRNGFWMGAAIAVVGSVARTRLRETPDFVDMKRRMQRILEEIKTAHSEKKDEFLKIKKQLEGEKIAGRTLLAYFLIAMGAPIGLYFNYIYCGEILKNIGYSPEVIIRQNFIISIIELVGMSVCVFLSFRIHPLKILKFKALMFLPFLGVFPFLLKTSPSATKVLCVQVIGAIFTLAAVPAGAVFYKYFPVLKRFTYTSFMYALSRASVSVTTSFGLVYLTVLWGYWGIYAILIPIALGFLWGVNQFEKLEEI